jgi:hypothetical protein
MVGELMRAEVEQFLAAYSPEIRELAWKVRALVLEVFPDAIEQLDPPAKLIGYGFDRGYKGLVCGVALHKAHVNLMFAQGTELPDPSGLLAGTGKRARHVKIQRPGDVDHPAIRALLEAAVARKRPMFSQ